MRRLPSLFAVSALLVVGAFNIAGGWIAASGIGTDAPDVAASAQFNDSHFHLTNYIQQGITPEALLHIMGSRVGRSTLFGIPLQQQWSYGNSGDYAPTYYLQSDAPLYYYSFTDAYIANAFRSLPPSDQARFDPMITGFNPADMYAVDHIRRVLEIYPGVFSGIGEFTIHKEFVSAKVAGGAPSLTNPALDRILDFAGDVGLVVLMHNDIDVPFAKTGQEPYQAVQLRDLFLRHPQATIVWAHAGLGRVVHPMAKQIEILDRLLSNPMLPNVHIDLSWTEAAKYIVASPASVAAMAALINRYPDRFLFGTDEVAPADQQHYLAVYDTYAPLLSQLTPAASEQFRKKNYERLFDEARRRVRAWERVHIKETGQ
jgi:amidohydrolase family protein